MPYSKRPDETPLPSVKASPATTPTSNQKQEPADGVSVKLMLGFVIAMGVFVGGLTLAVDSIASQPPSPPSTTETLVDKGAEVVEKSVEKAPSILEKGLDKASESLDNL